MLARAQDMLRPAALNARGWLFNVAFPLWSARGWDAARGGFHESLLLDGRPTGADRRAFVQARQIFCFCAAGELGWPGDWRAPVIAGRDYLIQNYRRADGAFMHKISADGKPIDERADLYDQAFVIFAMAHLCRLSPHDATPREVALGIARYLNSVRRHPLGGYRDDPPLMLRQNPHMHLLEAALAWIAIDPAGPWREMASDLVELVTRRMIDPATGALPEYFDDDWKLAGGRSAAVVEPGHQYEWIWLLQQWQALSGISTVEPRRGLLSIAQRHGHDRRHGVIVHDVDINGVAKTPHSRAWAQSERLRASIACLRACDPNEQPALLADAVEALAALDWFLNAPTPGLWLDTRTASGAFDGRTAPASTFYHLVSAFVELMEFAGRDPAASSSRPSPTGA